MRRWRSFIAPVSLQPNFPISALESRAAASSSRRLCQRLAGLRSALASRSRADAPPIPPAALGRVELNRPAHPAARRAGFRRRHPIHSLCRRRQGRGAHVTVLCSEPLRRLFTTVAGIDELHTDPGALPSFDVHCPLLSLPRLLGITLDTIPTRIPYIRTDPMLVQTWQSRLATEPQGLKVGIAWSGRQLDIANRKRFIAPEALQPLMQLPAVRFYSLQKDLPPGQSPPPGMTDWTQDLHDFADTAAFIAALDVVLSVDTVITHVAGAMGKMTGVLLPFSNDWRWLLGRPDSPWYPTVRLFRQPTRGVLGDADRAGVLRIARPHSAVGRPGPFFWLHVCDDCFSYGSRLAGANRTWCRLTHKLEQRGYDSLDFDVT